MSANDRIQNAKNWARGSFGVVIALLLVLCIVVLVHDEDDQDSQDYACVNWNFLIGGAILVFGGLGYYYWHASDQVAERISNTTAFASVSAS